MDATAVIKCEEDLKFFCCRYQYIFLYGAGKYGLLMSRFLLKGICRLAGYCVSEKDENSAFALPVYEIKDIPYPLSQCGFVFSLKESLQVQVKTSLFSKNIFLNSFRVSNEFFQYLQYLESPYRESFYPWKAYEKLRAYTLKPCVLIKREAGMGDVLSTEPIVRKLKVLGYQVFIVTEHPEVFSYNHDSIIVLNTHIVPTFIEEHSLVIDLNGAYENKPLGYVLDEYIERVRTVLPEFQLFQREKIPVYDQTLIFEHDRNNIKNICVNYEGTWSCRTYERTKMIAFIEYLKDKGYAVFEIGYDEHNYLGIGKKCYGMKLHDTVALMSTMDLYIGMDGGLMHFAQAIHLPMFIFFGCTCPNFRIHNWSITKVLWKNTDKLSCAGCHHRREAPRTFTECDRDKIYCMDWSVEEVILAFETKKFNDPPKLTDELYKPL
jgi:hypothetical protein